jgi:hypothetical protein
MAKHRSITEATWFSSASYDSLACSTFLGLGLRFVKGDGRCAGWVALAYCSMLQGRVIPIPLVAVYIAWADYVPIPRFGGFCKTLLLNPRESASQQHAPPLPSYLTTPALSKNRIPVWGKLQREPLPT